MSSPFREDSRRRQVATLPSRSEPTALGNLCRIFLQPCADRRLLLLAVSGAAALFATTLSVRGAEFSEDFDSEKPSWQIRVIQGTGARLQSHRRNLYFRRSGQASEQIQLRIPDDETVVQFEHEIPQSAVIEDAKLSVAVRANHPGLTPALRLVFPKQKDPRNGEVLTALLAGQPYNTPREWQTLEVPVSRRAVSDRLVRLRAELKSTALDLSEVYIDRVVLQSRLPHGTAEFFFDELRWTGFAELQTKISPVRFDKPAETRPDVEVRLDRILIRGQPVVLRFAPHHSEPLERLKELGLNTVWINDPQDSRRIHELQNLGLWSLVTPSTAHTTADQTTLSRHRGLLGYYLGTRVPPGAREEIQQQVRELQAMDRDHKLPVFADIGGLEHAYSRLLDGVGLSRHPLQTDFSLHEYRRFLTHKMQQLRPGTLVTTWIQTEVEPSSGSEQISDVSRRLVEPEQIRLLVWSALTAGYRGIGYWKRHPFDADYPGANEREQVIALVNQEIELLEPWLATHTVIEYEQIPVHQPRPSPRGNSQRLFATSRARQRREEARQQRLKPGPRISPTESSEFVELAMIHSPNGLLLVPVWYQRDAQFVPGRMATRGLTITIPGIPDTATVWEVSTTRVRTLDKKPAPRGVEIRIDEFDQVAALVVATDPNWGRILRNHIQKIRARSAELWLNLARAKLARVAAIDAQLQDLGAGFSSSRHVLAQARSFLHMAEESYQQGTAADSRTGVVQASLNLNASGFDATRRWSAASLQYLRVLQRKHWENAVERHGVAAFSPFTVSFQTLPDHWRLVREIGSISVGMSEDLLPNGDFEDTTTEQLIRNGWQHSQNDLPGIRARAELVRLRGGDGYSLRLLASSDPDADVPGTLEAAPIAVESPPIRVRAGQLVHIRGRVHVPEPLDATIDGVTLTENIQGTSLRWNRTRGWKSFELVRKADIDQDLTLRFTLHGIGEARFDDLRVVTNSMQRAPNQTPVTTGNGASEAQNRERRGLDFLKRLPILR